MANYLRTAVRTQSDYSAAASSRARCPTNTLSAWNQAAGSNHSAAGLTAYLTAVNPFAGSDPLEYKTSAGVSYAAIQLAQPTRSGWDELTAINSATAGGHHVTDIHLWRPSAVWISTSLTVLDIPLAAPQLFTALYSDRPSEYDVLAGELLLDLSGLLDFDDAPHIPGGSIDWGGRRLIDLAAQPLISGVMVAIHQPAAKDNELIAPWGFSTTCAYEAETPYLTEPPIIIPGDIPAANSARVNIKVNSVNVIALPSGEPLNVANIVISCDRQTFSWELTCEIRNKASLDLIKPDHSGYKELAVIINGHRFEFFVPKYSERRKVTSDNKLEKAWSITGFSRSQYLGQPYAPRRTRSLTSTTAVQAATNELVGTGFTLDWDTALLPDWNMPNSSFSYQDQTPIDVIKRLASVAGGIVLADPSVDTLYVRPCYQVAAWALLEANMDRVIHESQILSESIDSADQPLFNSVLVSGESDGVALTVTRLDTAGDSPAPDITDAWLTAIEGNTSRGVHELSASGNRKTYSLDLAIPETIGQPGLLTPGLMVAVLHDDSTANYRAYVDSISISAPGGGDPTVTQTVTLDRPTGWEAA